MDVFLKNKVVIKWPCTIVTLELDSCFSLVQDHNYIKISMCVLTLNESIKFIMFMHNI